MKSRMPGLSSPAESAPPETKIIRIVGRRFSNGLLDETKGHTLCPHFAVKSANEALLP